MVSDEERTARYEAMWEAGELLGDHRHVQRHTRQRRLERHPARLHPRQDPLDVDDPEVAEALCPTNHYVGTKRACLDTNYYETYNLPHVRLVDLRKDPISTITESGIDTANESFEFDAIVFATGFDAMTGAIVGVDITGRNGADAEGEVGRRTGHLPRADDVGVPEPVHDHRAGQPVGAVEHDGVDRAARRLDRRHDRSTCASTTSTTIEPTELGRDQVGTAQQRVRRPHADADRELVVHGRQRAGQAAGVPALPGRRRTVSQSRATRWSSAATSASRSTGPLVARSTTGSSAS